MEGNTCQESTFVRTDAAATILVPTEGYARRFVTLAAHNLIVPALTRTRAADVTRFYIQEAVKILQRKVHRQLENTSSLILLTNHFMFSATSGFVWALIQSFSLKNNPLFKNAMFGSDYPVNNANNDVVWNLYRLSLQQMWSIANQSTHFRATCNFLTEGLQYTDYARAKLKVLNIFGTYISCYVFTF